MSDYTEAELHQKITHWFSVLTFARSKYARTGATEDADSVKYALAKMNQYEDQLTSLKGIGTRAPICGSGGCGQVMSTFGTQTWLCPICDLRECVGCRERIQSLTDIECRHCGYIVLAPRSADEELD